MTGHVDGDRGEMGLPQRDAQRELDDLYRDVMETDVRGARLLDDLIVRFGGGQASTSGGIDAVLKTYLAVGQREVVDYIVRRINRANGVRDAGRLDD